LVNGVWDIPGRPLPNDWFDCPSSPAGYVVGSHVALPLPLVSGTADYSIELETVTAMGGHLVQVQRQQAFGTLNANIEAVQNEIDALVGNLGNLVAYLNGIGALRLKDESEPVSHALIRSGVRVGQWIIFKVLKAAAQLVPYVGATLGTLISIPEEILDFVVDSYQDGHGNVFENFVWGCLERKVLPWLMATTGFEFDATTAVAWAKYVFKSIVEMLNLYFSYKKMDYDPKSLTPFYQMYYESIIPVATEAQRQIGSAVMSIIDATSVNLMPYHGLVVAKFPKIVAGNLVRDCVVVNVANAGMEGGDVVIDLLTKSHHDWVGVKTWRETYDENTGWQNLTELKDSAFLVHEGYVTCSFPDAVAYAYMMQRRSGRYDLIGNNCQNISSYFIDFLVDGKIPLTWRDAETDIALSGSPAYDTDTTLIASELVALSNLYTR
jgi:hypothetical protein